MPFDFLPLLSCTGLAECFCQQGSVPSACMILTDGPWSCSQVLLQVQLTPFQ